MQLLDCDEYQEARAMNMRYFVENEIGFDFDFRDNLAESNRKSNVTCGFVH